MVEGSDGSCEEATREIFAEINGTYFLLFLLMNQ